MTSELIDFSQPLTGAESTPESARLISGVPRQSAANYFTDSSEQFFAGRWSSTRGKWRIRYTESEFCCITQGRVALENLGGRRWEFGVGAAFVVPSGFEGTWEVIEDCTKLYALFEQRT